LLSSLQAEDFDLGSIGFDDDDLADMLKAPPVAGQTDPDDVPEVPQNIHGVKRGDIWQLGAHRLLCGDSTNREDVERLMAGEKADMVFTDPPYNQSAGLANNTNAEKHVVKRTKILRDSGLNNFEPSGFLSVLTALDIDTLYIFCSKNLIATYINYAETASRRWELLAATKKNCMPLRKGHFLNDVEWLIFYRKPGAYFDESLDHNFYSKFRSMKQVNTAEDYHPTRKDVGYIEPLIKISSPNKAIVLDLFLGSGSTLIACEKTGRKCFGMEIDEHYCSVIIERWQNFTGQKAAKLP
jgi:DNA modification methylase